MKINIKDLGVLKKAEFDLKPLTIFIGPNNMGKTWTAYALSAVLGSYGLERFIYEYGQGRASERFSVLDAALQSIKAGDNVTLNLVEFIEQHQASYLKQLIDVTCQSLPEFMGTNHATFEALQIAFDIPFTESSKTQIQQLAIEKHLFAGLRQKQALFHALKEENEETLYFYATTKQKILDELPGIAVRGFIIETMFRAIHQLVFKTTEPFLYVFPTERSTYATIPINKLEDRFTKTEHPYSRGNIPQTETSLAFIGMLEAAFEAGEINRQQAIKQYPQIEQYRHIATLLEQQILGGQVDFSTSEPAPWRELQFQPAHGPTLDMPIVSSMVKELSALVLYLRYLAQPHEWIIIDEPEMNLHPKAQVQLMELLAMLVNADIQVLFTTHSPYMVDHLVNSMKAATHPNPATIANKFYLQRSEAFITQDKVSVMLFDGGDCQSILNEDGSIAWETFSDVSDEISDLYFEIT
ncbi:ATP-binding protein [Anaerolineales bacterium HSG24]|nr:ATP-binding protein [Anaerolineales bacterium HSG24]